MTAKGKPGARQERAAIEETLYQNILSVEFHIKKPNVLAIVVCSHDTVQYSDLGFSKVCWPDEWDKEYGESLAKHKAICAIAKRIQECQPPTEWTD